MIVVTGHFDGAPITLSFGSAVPAEVRLLWDQAISAGLAVGPPHWRRVPSYDEPEGFVAGALWALDDPSVEGFVVPEPDPDLIY